MTVAPAFRRTARDVDVRAGGETDWESVSTTPVLPTFPALLDPMHGTHYAFAAAARALDARLGGATLAAAYTQHRDELRLVFGTDDGPLTAVVALRPPALYALADAARARRNVADVLPDAVGRRVTSVRVADLDRHVYIVLDGGRTGEELSLDLVLFGPRPNVLLVRGGTVQDAFLAPSRLVGTDAPAARPARLPTTAADLAARLAAGGDGAARLARAFPTFDALLAAEALYRADLDDPADDPARAFDAARALHRDALASDAATVWWDGAPGETLRAVAFSTVPLHHRPDLRPEAFPDVLAALRVFSRRRHADAAFARRFAALAQQIDGAATDLAARADRLLDALAQPSRADVHEAEGHLLMAHLRDVAPGTSSVALADFDGTPCTLALDPALTAVQNAEARYARARRLRTARTVAETRLDEAVAAAAEAEALRQRLIGAATLADLDTLADAAAPLLRQNTARPDDARLPYHRIDLGQGYEAWVGRTSRDNDALTLRHARPYDLWLHARGVPGSHVVLRVKGRADVPPKAVVERAAGLAAAYSKARTSALVPVVATPRKWVRKAKGSAPGQVVVEREAEVLIVPPTDV